MTTCPIFRMFFRFLLCNQSLDISPEYVLFRTHITTKTLFRIHTVDEMMVSAYIREHSYMPASENAVILSCCGALSDFGPDPAGCPFRCCLKLLCGPPFGPVR